MPLDGVRQITETYYTNRYGQRFPSRNLAKEDEERRDQADWEVKIIGGHPDNSIPSYEAIDDTKAPFTGQKDGKCHVYLLRDKIERYQALIDKHGLDVGYTTHHCGMGNYSTELVILKPYDHEKHNESRWVKNLMGGGTEDIIASWSI